MREEAAPPAILHLAKVQGRRDATRVIDSRQVFFQMNFCYYEMRLHPRTRTHAHVTSFNYTKVSLNYTKFVT